jgi:hypothetical protein
MMRNFLTLGAFSKGRKPEGGGDLGGKGATPNPGEVEVMTNFD